MPDNPAGKALYLFKSGRRERLMGREPFPSELFYGYCELKTDGAAVDFMDESELVAAGSGNPPSRLLRAIFGLVFAGLPAAVEFAVVLARRANLARLNRASAIVATTNTFGLSLALLRRVGLLKAPIVFVAMGVMPERLTPWSRWLGRWLLGACTVVALSKFEATYLTTCLRSRRPVHYLPFGVDTKFWTPTPDRDDFILAIGNDRHRDYATLVDAWQPHYPRLKIVTRLPVPTNKPNIEVIRGDWREQLLSDDTVRTMMRACRFVVLPLHDTLQPSGQSVCLQAMACGKTVVMSAIRGLWDREALRDGETCLLVEPGSTPEFRAAVESLLKGPGLAQKLGERACRETRTRFHVAAMAATMAGILRLGRPVEHLTATEG